MLVMVVVTVLVLGWLADSGCVCVGLWLVFCL